MLIDILEIVRNGRNINLTKIHESNSITMGLRCFYQVDNDNIEFICAGNKYD